MGMLRRSLIWLLLLCCAVSLFGCTDSADLSDRAFDDSEWILDFDKDNSSVEVIVQ